MKKGKYVLNVLFMAGTVLIGGGWLPLVFALIFSSSEFSNGVHTFSTFLIIATIAGSLLIGFFFARDDWRKEEEKRRREEEDQRSRERQEEDEQRRVRENRKRQIESRIDDIFRED